MKSQESNSQLLTIDFKKPNVEAIKKKQNFIENAIPRLDSLEKEPGHIGLKKCTFCDELLEQKIYDDLETDRMFSKSCNTCYAEAFLSEKITVPEITENHKSVSLSPEAQLEKSNGGWYSKNRPIKVISWGVGMDSTMLVSKYGLDADIIVFCDTGAEEIETYAYLQYIMAKLPYRIREKIVVIENHNLGAIDEWYFDSKLQPMPFANRQCTDKWKLRIIHNYLRTVYGTEAVFEMMVGINYDEQVERERTLPSDAQLEYHITNVLKYDSARLVTLAKKAKVGVEDYKERLRNALQTGAFTKTGEFEPGLQYARNIYPLCENKIGKDDEKVFYEEEGLQIPPKSGCYFCPMKSKKEWKRLESEQPDLYENAKRISTNSTAKIDMLEMSEIKKSEMRCSCNNGVYLEKDMEEPEAYKTAKSGRGF